VPDYEPDPRSSFAHRAAARGCSALEAIYDHLAEGEGANLVYFPIFNYLRGSLDTVHRMLTHPQALLALSDGGAHVGTVCDASFPTTLISHWTRDRDGARLSLAQAVHMLSARNAAHLGLGDRGLVAVGQRADLNLIEIEKVAPLLPQLVRDLPAGGRRFVQKARGYVATLVAGEIVCEGGELTGARPGRWVRA
jgi:N-acyl-D-aspartate/D-glutamate deacylase